MICTENLTPLLMGQGGGTHNHSPRQKSLLPAAKFYPLQSPIWPTFLSLFCSPRRQADIEDQPMLGRYFSFLPVLPPLGTALRITWYKQRVLHVGKQSGISSFYRGWAWWHTLWTPALRRQSQHEQHPETLSQKQWTTEATPSKLLRNQRLGEVAQPEIRASQAEMGRSWTGGQFETVRPCPEQTSCTVTWLE